MGSCNVKIIKPHVISASEIVAHNLTEDADYVEWNASTTYKKGQIVRYKSLLMISDIEANQGNKPLYIFATDAEHGYVPSEKLFYFDNGNYIDYLSYNNATNYAVGARFYEAKQQNRVFEVLTAGAGKRPAHLSNKQLEPLSDAPWILFAETNPMRFLDLSSSTKTSTGTTLTIEILPSEIFTYVALFNLDASSVTLTVTDESDNSNELFSETQNAFEGFNDFWEYCYLESTPKNNLIFNVGGGGYRNKKITLTINHASKAGLGLLVIGREIELGELQLSSGMGVKSFADIKKNNYGVTSINDAPIATNLDLPMSLPADQFDTINNVLSPLVGHPILAVGTERFDTMLSYGLFRRFYQNIRLSSQVECTFEMEKLV